MSSIVFGANVPVVTVQFLFSNEDLVPRMLREKSGTEVRKQAVPGEVIVPQSADVDTSNLLYCLRELGYEVAEGLRTSKPGSGKSSQIVRFDCTHREAPRSSVTSAGYLNQSCDVLCEDAFWSMVVYRNPFYHKGQLVPGKNHISFNFAGRLARCHGDGNPVCARRRDQSGKKVGEPAPLEPQHLLDMVGNEIIISPTRQEAAV